MVYDPAMRILTAFILVLFSARGSFGAAADCDRSCLRTMLDQYLNAVIKHDPAAAPLFAGFRQTENAVAVRLGTGMWKTVTGLGKMQRRYLDPVSGQAAYFGIIEENGVPAIVTIRARVENRKITEAEWLIARKGDPGLNGPAGGNVFDADNLAANPPPDKPMARELRASREAMMAITNSYFDGITSHNGSVIMAHAGCVRIENGLTMTGRTTGPGVTGDCTSNLERINIQFVAARRYPVIDEEAGVALAIAVFIRPPGSMTRRNVFGEWFLIENNRIRTIWSAMFYPPPELPVPNWPPYEGNWPLPPTNK